MFQQFLKERRYLNNVTESTIDWHQQSLKWLGIEQPTEADLKEFVLRMREAGLSSESCNCRIRSVNAYLRWLGSPLKVPKLRTEQMIPATYTQEQLGQIIRWKPKSFYERRLHTLLLTIFDTGIRHNEVLSVRVTECDLDNLLLTITGKGRKQRLVPFSFYLRRIIAKYIIDFRHHPTDLIFATRDGRKLGQRNVLRDVKRLCTRLGFEAPRRSVHATRHTFGTEYVRRGGSPFHLMTVLGQTTLAMAKRYSHLAVEDLQEMHPKVSLLK